MAPSQVVMNWKVHGRKRSWHKVKVLSQHLPRRNWVKPRKTSVRIAGLRADIWTWDVSNTKQECSPLDHDVRWPGVDGPEFVWRKQTLLLLIVKRSSVVRTDSFSCWMEHTAVRGTLPQQNSCQCARGLRQLGLSRTNQLVGRLPQTDPSVFPLQ
jgi:hypothetical protein